MAEDRFEEILHETTFGGVPIRITAIDDVGGREKARHMSPHKDGAELSDRGGVPRVTSCALAFLPVAGDPDFYGRFLEFMALVDSGEAYEFVHPLTGSYLAEPSDVSFRIAPGERDLITVQVVFEESGTNPAVFEAGAGGPALAATEIVAASVADLEDALEETEVELEDDVAAASTETVEGWEDPDKTQREINLELLTLSNRIAAETDRLELASDLEAYPVLVALQGLHYNLRRAAETITEKSPRIIQVTVEGAIPLRVLAARLYGADQSDYRYEELRKLNTVRNPARVEEGTVLRAYSPHETRRQLRRPA